MSQRIRVLPPAVAERIAAGEVIERPASVVKELVENALDAQATEILINLEDGGKGLIEILDNGHGMFPEDLALCVQRHATSKLSSLADLEKISSLGFRGEALPSIAAVSDLQILSRAKNADSAYELRVGDLTERFLASGASTDSQGQLERITFGHFNGAFHGTRIQARGLFSQVPARLKFLKSASAEASAVKDWLERISIAYPQVGFRFVSNDRTLLNLRPQDEVARVQAILSDEDQYPVHSIHHEGEPGIQIKLHWLQGYSSPQGRKLIQIVNFRALKDRVLQQATLAPFRQLLLPGQFPAVAVVVQIDPAWIDVNVHPTKTEVRFLHPQRIFQIMDSLVRSLTQKVGAPAVVPLQPVFHSSPSTPEYKPQPLFFSPPPSAPTTPYWRAEEVRSPILPESQSNSSIPHRSVETRAHPFSDARVVGMLFNTYGVYEYQSELILVDQHAAHERIRYEKLKASHLKQSHHSQQLLIPEVIHFDTEQRNEIESRISTLSQFGFECEVFGEDALVFRALPSIWGTHHLKIRLKNLTERLLNLETTGGRLLEDESLFEALASEACHSAIRAGDRLTLEEIQHLTTELFQCEHPWNCPHGRPTLVKIPQGKLEEWFQRKV